MPNDAEDNKKNAQDFKKLTTTIKSLYDISGICVSCVKVTEEMWVWLLEQYKLYMYYGTWEPNGSCTKCFAESNPEAYGKKDKTIRFLIQPKGCDQISVKTSMISNAPWKIIVQPKEQEPK